ncbi:GPN-loop GTPase 3 [Senna tora]|uniref:GPN-loop GTPase 3 n=1 Tax=Senna tora TaxID=362788 RepID=A0A834XIM4_9FABA|nr:GPN-loop GTPase 3 [Senna tora]
MGYAQLVIGPAGSGKSTYCSSLYQHCETVRRTMHVVNLDPAAENFDYPVAMDIRELISLDDVMEELGLGPNGGLMYCMEYPFLCISDKVLVSFLILTIFLFSFSDFHLSKFFLNLASSKILWLALIIIFRHLEDNLDNWFAEELDNYLDDDYLVFDCPGQIELYSHMPVLRNFVEHLKRKDFNVCAVYLLDSQFMTDVTKFISGCMACLSAMVQLELPHVNILSKMDLVTNKKDIEEFLDPDPRFLLSELNKRMAPQFTKLNKSLIELLIRSVISHLRCVYCIVNDYSMVSFIPLDLRKESSIRYVLAQIDSCIQFGEDADVKVKDFDPPEDDE